MFSLAKKHNMMSDEPNLPVSLTANLDADTPLLEAIQRLDGVSVARYVHGDYDIDCAETVRALLLAVKMQHAGLLQQLLTCVRLHVQHTHVILIQAVLANSASCVSVLVHHRPHEVDTPDALGWTPLLLAAACAHKQSVTALLQAGATGGRDIQGNSPLLLAAKSGCESTVELLITTSSLCDRNTNGRTALHEAALVDHDSVLVVLLRRGADVASRDNMGQTALTIAAKHGCSRALATLATYPNAGLNATDVISMTPLHWAVLGGHTACVHVLLGARARTRTFNVGTGNTALMHAAELGHPGIVRLLIRARSNVNATNCQKRTALHVAAERGHVDVIILLLEGGAVKDAKTANGDTALMFAVRFHHAAAMDVLLKAGCDTKLSNTDGMTALHEASLSGDTCAVRLLLATGTPAALVEGDGDTALMLAAARGHVDTVATLLASGKSEPDSCNQLGRSACLQAAAQGHVDVVALLLAAGVDKDMCDIEGDSAFLLAACKGHVGVICCLLWAGCNVAHTNTWGRNALHEAAAAWHGSVATTQLLLTASDLPLDSVDRMHTTPLILAVLGGRQTIVGALLAANCNADMAGEWPDERRVTPIQLAIKHGAFIIARMLRLAGCHLCPTMLRRKTNMPLQEWLMDEITNAQTLKAICRANIRNSLRPGNVVLKVDNLLLPNALKQFLLLNDLDQLQVGAPRV